MFILLVQNGNVRGPVSSPDPWIRVECVIPGVGHVTSHSLRDIPKKLERRYGLRYWSCQYTISGTPRNLAHVVMEVGEGTLGPQTVDERPLTSPHQLYL